MGAGFGDANNPLLVSVRSGARVSMPGMMDTVLNLGLNDARCWGSAKSSGDERFAWDSYRRFIQMYGDVVLDVGHHDFEEALELKKEDLGVHIDTELKADDWRAVVSEFKKIVEKRTGKPFPQEPREQLWGAIGAVFGSWMNQRAITYRRLHRSPRAGAPRSTCRPWSSATWATIAPPASPSRAIPPPAATCSTASTW